MRPPIIETAITSWAELTSALDELAGRMPQAMFRGQGNYSWRLRPSINRFLAAASPMQASALEDASVRRFMGEAHEHLAATSLPRDPFGLDVFDNYVEWLALMQHHGAPTRMLDWSFSPYVALYFAVEGEPNDDAALWYFDHGANWRVFCQRFGVPEYATFDYRALPTRLLSNPGATPPFLFGAVKKMRSAREIAQQGAFTFCDQLLADHEATLLAQLPGACGKIRIPHALKLEIWWRLRQMNLTPAALFPGVDGVCQSIREEFVRWRP
jgi:hypothetical protein